MVEQGDIKIYGPTGTYLKTRGGDEPKDGYRVSHRAIEITEEERIIGQATSDLFENTFRRPQPWTILNEGAFRLPKVKALRDAVIRLTSQNSQEDHSVEAGKKDFQESLNSALTPRLVTDVEVLPIRQIQNERIPSQLANVLETFYLVERYLPDFGRVALSVLRNYKGLTEAYYQWIHEEDYHSLMDRAILLATGSRTRKDLDDLDDLLLNKEWIAPFITVRRMMAYAFLQERMTRDAYEVLARNLEVAGAPYSAEGLRWISNDEGFHGAWFKSGGLLEFAKLDREGTEQDVYFVASHFRMPLDFIAPDLKQRARNLKRGLGIQRSTYARKLYQYMCELPFVDKKKAFLVAGAYASIDLVDQRRLEEILLSPTEAGKL